MMMMTRSLMGSVMMMMMMMVMMMTVPVSGYNPVTAMTRTLQRLGASVIVSSSLLVGGAVSDVVAADIPVVPVYSKRSTDLQSYSDASKGFKLLRPFGYNEFDGVGGGYAVKFASLFDVDENVIVGSAPATAGKTSIVDYGDLEELGKKLATKRGGVLKSASARQTEGIVFYQYEFENPLDPSLPRTGPKNNRPTVGVELYELSVNKGRLWSVQATSNDKLFKDHEQTLRHVLASFLPRL